MKCLNRPKMLTHYRCMDPYPVYLINLSVHRRLVTSIDQYQRHRRNHHHETIETIATIAFLSFSWLLQAFRDVHALVAQPRLFRLVYALMDRDSGMKMTNKQTNKKKKSEQFQQIVMSLLGFFFGESFFVSLNEKNCQFCT